MMKNKYNAIILAAGFASRFVPLSYERHKALINVNGEVLIERQICQLQEAGIDKIYIVVGYKKEDFYYLEKKFGVYIIVNENYDTMNNISSIYAAKDYIGNSFICSADNYFQENPFLEKPSDSFYSVVYSEGETNEWCIDIDSDGYISNVTIGGCKKWYMLGHVFWSEDFSREFFSLLESEYNLPETASMLWENFFIKHIDKLKMSVKKYPEDFIFEFDNIDELRAFDVSYDENTRSLVVKEICNILSCNEKDIYGFSPKDERTEFNFIFGDIIYTCKLNNGLSVVSIKNYKGVVYERKI